VRNKRGKSFVVRGGGNLTEALGRRTEKGEERNGSNEGHATIGKKGAR